MVEIFSRLCYSLYKTAREKWGEIIKKLHRKRKEWLQRKNHRLMRKRAIKNKRRRKYSTQTDRPIFYADNEYRKIDESRNQYFAIAPKHLSIIDNCEETLCFFNGIFDDLANKTHRRKYAFDISAVETLTNDAIMYILAIVYNIKNSGFYKYDFEGNVPKNAQAKRLFEESGFLNYVNTTAVKIEPSSDKLQIITGKGPNPDAAVKAVDFVAASASFSRADKRLKALYRILIELTGNAGSHAYGDSGGAMKKSWYMFAEKKSDRVKFVFLDTGRGIPATVRKKFIEQVGFRTEEGLLLSAFTNPNRSRTKQANRGLGLPATYEICKKSLVSNFSVISGGGKCEIDTGSEKTASLSTKLYGTLFYWEILFNSGDAL